MKTVRNVLLIVALLVASLWAKTEYYILPVILDGVHEDYAEKIVTLTKNYLIVDGNEIVSDPSECDYVLQIKLIRKEKGIALFYEKMNKKNEVLWSYGRIVYSPDDFVPVVSYVSREIDKRNVDFIWGFGFGALGMVRPVKIVDYNYEPFVQLNIGSVALSSSFTFAFIGSKTHSRSGSFFAVNFSVAYMFGHHYIVPYLGVGANFALIENKVKVDTPIELDSVVNESVKTPGVFLKIGAALKTDNEGSVMLEARYFREFKKMKKAHSEEKNFVHGFSVGVKFGV